jgi:NADH dehydrogenase
VSIPAAVFRQLVGSGGSLGRLFERSAHRYQSREVIDALARRLPAPVLTQPVSRVMHTDLITLHPAQSVASALPTVRDRSHSSYPLVDDEGRVVGVLQREDFHDFIRRSPHAGESPVRAVGVTTVPTVTPEASMREAVERLVRTGANKLLVADADGVLRGIVTVMDLAAAAPEVAHA